MKVTATILATLALSLGTASACRQMSCAGDVCEASPEQASNALCSVLAGLKSANGTPLPGRDGCGWSPEPATGDAAAFGCEAGLNRYTGTLMVWRANDVDADMSKIEAYTMFGPDKKSNVGGCKVVKNVDC